VVLQATFFLTVIVPYCQSAPYSGLPLECAPPAGHAESLRLTRELGLAGVRPWLVIASSLAFKKQVVQEYAAGATLNALAREHDLSRTLIRVWVAKCESGEFDPDVEAATLLGDYEAKIATLERMVGRQAVEIEFLKGALQQGRSPRSAPMSVIAGPAVSPSLKDAG
jgi:transposase